ncbi:MAG: hypothetical protein JRG86_04730 [Deltaproteobacteria bacterium]|nr:hypothetical protein [Deltaproteobacteria bacterium]MBW2499147.1 hypothetical protein [Deltaproteobacteria bacterium]
MSDDEHQPGERDRGKREGSGLPSLDEHLAFFFNETTLWPVLIVLVASLGAMGAAAIVLAFGDRNPFAALALLLVAGMSADLGWRARRRRELRRVAASVAVLWLVSGLLAAAALYFGIA